KLHSIGFGGMVYEGASGYVGSKGKGEGKRTAPKVGGGPGLGGRIGGIGGGGGASEAAVRDASPVRADRGRRGPTVKDPAMKRVFAASCALLFLLPREPPASLLSP